MSLDALLTSPALAGMRALRQWILYVAYPDEKKPGKLAKIPVHPSTGMPCSVVDPNNWTDAATAIEAARRFGQPHGVGFCFTADDPYWFVDLDGALQPDGAWSPLAEHLVTQALAGAAVEISASGKGLHLFGRGVVPPHASKNFEHHAELYTSGRFVALTGTALQGNCDTDLSAGIAWLAQTYFPPKVVPAAVLTDGPSPEWRGPTDDEELLRRALRSQSAGAAFGGKAAFADLWERRLDVLARSYPGDGEAGVDWSSVDAALAQHLAFWTGCDQARMVALMQRSALVRPKWEREDYLPRTVLSACGMQRDVLQDKVPEQLLVQPVPSGPPTPPEAAPAQAGQVAVTMVEREGSTFVTPVQAAGIFAGCYYISEQHKVLAPGGKLYKPEQFNAVLGGHCWVMDNRNERTTRKAFEAFTENQVYRPTVADGLAFRPDLPYGTVIDTEGRRRVNAYWPANVRRVRGDPLRFLQHLEKILPNPGDRDVLLYYLANCVQHPGHKAQWLPLLVGAEGNGKSLVSRVLAYCVGQRYSHWPDASKLGNQFNGWIFGKLAILIEDLQIGDALHVWEKLKPMITGENLEIEGKGIDQRTDEVCANFIANSNHKNAIRATMNDRRVCHLWTAQQNAADVISAGLDEGYMSGIYDWLRADGYAIVAEFLHTLQIPEEYGLRWFKGRAPKSTAHNSAVRASLGLVEQEVLEAIEREDQGFRGGWISSHYFAKLLEGLGRDRSVPPNRRRELLVELGYDWHPVLAPQGGVTNNQVLPDGVKTKLFVEKGSPAAALRGTPAEIAAAYSRAQGVGR